MEDSYGATTPPSAQADVDGSRTDRLGAVHGRLAYSSTDGVGRSLRVVRLRFCFKALSWLLTSSPVETAATTEAPTATEFTTAKDTRPSKPNSGDRG